MNTINKLNSSLFIKLQFILKLLLLNAVSFCFQLKFAVCIQSHHPKIYKSCSFVIQRHMTAWVKKEFNSNKQINFCLNKYMLF